MRPSVALTSPLAFASLALVALLPACGGGQSASQQTWTGQGEEQQSALRDTEGMNPTPVTQDALAQTAWIGVRHDLMLSKAPHSSRCSCLAVEVGPPQSKNFFWTSKAPDIGTDALALAIGAQGVDCPGGDPDELKRRPSISAIDEENGDIILEIEDVPASRPLASGAIIPKPKPEKGIYVRPKSPKVLYGRGATGDLCKIRSGG